MIRHRKGSEPTGWQPFAEGLREINIPQDVIGNRDRWDWMHQELSSPRTSRIPVSVRKTNQRKLEKLKLLHSPKKLSATKNYIKEQLFSPNPKEELFSPKQWLSFDEQK